MTGDEVFAILEQIMDNACPGDFFDRILAIIFHAHRNIYDAEFEVSSNEFIEG